MLSRKTHPGTFFVLDTMIGALLCAIIAGAFVLLTRGSSARTMLPLVFIGVIVVIALRFGALAGALGALLATLVFSYFLFTPVGSFKVQKGEARTNLIWMVMLGVPAGYFIWATKIDARKDQAKLPPTKGDPRS